MSIAPVEGFPPAKSEQAANASAGSAHAEAGNASGAAEKATEPVSGTLPKQKESAAKKAPTTYALPQDVVELHQDPEIKDQIIVQYLDQAKNVILQVPSNEELGVERGIAQEFQQAVKLRARAATTEVANKGGKAHGD